jgi:hypothetical protein
MCCGPSMCGTCGCYNCSCADSFCGGCLSGSTFTPCSTTCVPDAGSPVPICTLPLTNPTNDPALEPLTSPCSHGSVDGPPHPVANSGSGQGFGSGAGTAKQASGSVPLNRPANSAQTNLLGSLLSKLGVHTGASVAGLPGKVSTSGMAPMQNASVTSSSFILVIGVIGILAFLIFSGHGE